MSADTRRQLNGSVVLLAVIGLLIAAPRAVHAQERLGKFLGGAAVAFVAHESGHVLLNTAFGAGVALKHVQAGPFPFFAITHHPVSPAREFAISSAGFWVQHAADELILTRRPQLRSERAPFLKGMLAFNVLTSVGYSIAAFAQSGPDERDTRGMGLSARVPEPWIGAVILTPAVLDATRYYRGDVVWVKWASRALKVGGALLIIKAAE